MGERAWIICHGCSALTMASIALANGESRPRAKARRLS
jgi:hypothetical protein